MSEKKEMMSLTECAVQGKVTRQAIYVAIKKKKLKGVKVRNRWKISPEDFKAYRTNKYNRDELVRDGELVYDWSKGRFSVHQASKILSDRLKRRYPMQKLYYGLRIGLVKGFKMGAAWIVEREEIERIWKEESQGKENPSQMKFA